MLYKYLYARDFASTVLFALPWCQSWHGSRRARVPALSLIFTTSDCRFLASTGCSAGQVIHHGWRQERLILSGIWPPDLHEGSQSCQALKTTKSFNSSRQARAPGLAFPKPHPLFAVCPFWKLFVP